MAADSAQVYTVGYGQKLYVLPRQQVISISFPSFNIKFLGNILNNKELVQYMFKSQVTTATMTRAHDDIIFIAEFPGLPLFLLFVLLIARALDYTKQSDITCVVNNQQANCFGFFIMTVICCVTVITQKCI